MKKLNTISVRLSIFVLTILFTGLSSCSKGDSITSIEKSLKGTIWENNDVANQELTTITFLTNTTFRMNYKDLSDGYIDSGEGTYVYEFPSITIHINGDTDSGTVSANTMDLDYLGVFTKK